MGNGWLGKRHTEETKIKMSKNRKGKNPVSKCSILGGKARGEYFKQNGIGPFSGRKHSEESKLKIQNSLLGKRHSEERIGNIIEGLKRYGKSYISPNKKELQLLEIIAPYGFYFVGNGELVIKGKFPDFWDGGKKLVELFGDYWHRNDDPQDRISLFANEGYKCLVVWEHELKDIDLIKEKVLNFIARERCVAQTTLLD